jgi:ABC-type branched-subunit amino acid transport system substrate-binding protein
VINSSRAIKILIATGLFVCGLYGQNYSQREKSILKANIELYRQGDFKKAEQNFALVITKLPQSSLITTNYLMLVKTQYKMKDYVSALEQGKKFLHTFPESSYRDDVLFVMGNSYYRLDRFSTAVKTWATSIDEQPDPRLDRKLQELITGVIKYKINEEDLKTLYQDRSLSVDGHMLVSIGAAERAFLRGSTTLARNILSTAINDYSDSRYLEKAKSLLGSADGFEASDETFALLLPLSGYNEDIGNAILNGAELAINEFNKQHNLDLKLAVRDYGQEITEAIKNYQELAGNPNILAVMGPLENDIAAACAAISKYESVPLLSPTATANDLTDFSPYFFQLGSNINVSAKAMARYALDSLKIHRFATFAPIDDHFLKMVDQFKETVSDAGGEVVAQEWYYPGDQDVYKQFMNIKRIGLKLAFTDSVLMELPDADQIQLDSMYDNYIELEKEKLEESKTSAKIDSADIPVTSIEAIFIPIFKEDLQFIAPQIAYSNIQSQYLGNKDWYDLEGLKKNKNYINGIIFGADGYLNEESWDYRQFRNEFRETFKKTPTIYAVMGYDSFKYILEAYKPRTSNTSRKTFFQNLQNLNKYNGIYRTFNINHSRSNQYIQLLKYNFGQVIPLH